MDRVAIRQLYTLRLYLPGTVYWLVWQQDGVAYGSIDEVFAVWSKVSKYLPPGTRGQAILLESGL